MVTIQDSSFRAQTFRIQLTFNYEIYANLVCILFKVNDENKLKQLFENKNKILNSIIMRSQINQTYLEENILKIRKCPD